MTHAWISGAKLLTPSFINRIPAGHFFKFGTSSTMEAEQLSYNSVQHDEKRQEFFIAIPNGSQEERAFIQYDLKGNTMDIYHTLVPPAFRGRGVAKLLTKRALDFTVENNYKLIPSCTYVAKYIKDNPSAEYTNRL